MSYQFCLIYYHFNIDTIDTMAANISAGEACKMGIGFALGYCAYKLICSSSVFHKLIPYLTSRGQNASAKSLHENSQQIKQQQQEIKQELTELTELQELLTYKCANFEVETAPQNQGVLSKKCLLSFFAETFDILDEKQIVEISTESRRARRQVFSELDTKFVCTLDENIKYLIEKAQKDFAVFLNLDYRKVMDSISYHIDDEETQEQAEEFRIQIVQIMSGMRQNLANYMPLFHSPIPKEQLSEIVKYQSSLLESNKEMLVELAQKMGLETKEQEEALPLFVTCFLEDSIWKKYGVESEQMSVLSEDMDEELKTGFEKFKMLRQSVIKDMHFSIQDNLILNKS